MGHAISLFLDWRKQLVKAWTKLKGQKKLLFRQAVRLNPISDEYSAYMT
jgi:hypothetical protein